MLNGIGTQLLDGVQENYSERLHCQTQPVTYASDARVAQACGRRGARAQQLAMDADGISRIRCTFEKVSAAEASSYFIRISFPNAAGIRQCGMNKREGKLDSTQRSAGSGRKTSRTVSTDFHWSQRPKSVRDQQAS